MKIGIAASVGGLRPLGLVGVLQAMEEKGLYSNIAALSGSSGGSISTAFAAVGYMPNKIAEILSSIKSKDVYMDPRYANFAWKAMTRKLLQGWTGVMDGGALRDWLYQHLGDKTFDDVVIPLYIWAHNINESREHLFGTGINATPVRIYQAVRASTAIPLAYRHETIKIYTNGPDCGLSDGGVENELPLSSLTDFHDLDVIIAFSAVSKKAQGGWKSIDDMTLPEMLLGAFDARLDAHNDLLVKYARMRCPVFILKARHPISMSHPEDIPEAIKAGLVQGREFFESNQWKTIMSPELYSNDTIRKENPVIIFE